MESPVVQHAPDARDAAPEPANVGPRNPRRGPRSTNTAPANEDRPDLSNDPFEALARALQKALPGVSLRTGHRFARHLLAGAHRTKLLRETLTRSEEQTCICSHCGNLAFQDPCSICTNPRRDPSVVVIVKNVEALQTLEASGAVRGRYQVLGDVPTTVDFDGTRKIPLFRIGHACSEPDVREVVMALDDTPEAASIEAFIAGKIQRSGLRITRLARGMPMGADIDKLDEGTLAVAMTRRTAFQTD